MALEVGFAGVLGVLLALALGLENPEAVDVAAGLMGSAFLTGSTFFGVVVLTAVGFFTVAGLGFIVGVAVFVGFTTLGLTVVAFGFAVVDVLRL